MNEENQKKKHPGQAGSDDGEQLKRTKVIEINLSPVELKSFKDEWRKTEFNSMAKFARYKLFGGQEHKIDLPLSHNSCRLHRTTPTPSTQGR